MSSNQPSNKQTLKEFGRGIIGGLLFSLPIVYTMEVWWAGFIAPPGKLLAFVLVTFLLLLGYNKFAGMRKDASFWDNCWDSVEEIGLGFILTFLFLLLINRVGLTMSFDEIAGKVVVESMIVAIGISVGTAELGQKKDSNSGEDDEKGKKTKGDNLLQLAILSICGAVLISSSVAPTEEILKIAVESTNIHLLLMVVTSLLLSIVILYFSDFKGSATVKVGIKKMVLHIMIGYIAALLVSFGFLWFFGKLDGFGFYIIVAQIVVLAIPGTLGASAGRLLLD